MEVIARLEAKFEEMMNKISVLEEENQRLKSQFEQEAETKRQITARVERLLERIEEQNG